MAWQIPLSDVSFGPEEMQAVQQVVASKWLSMGEVTATFERCFADFLGVRYAVAVSSGTAALHLALAALGIGVGDEVIVPSLTFVATANAILYMGATPIFVDVESTEDFSLAPAAIEQALTPATKAIMVVHYGGYAADMAAIHAVIAGRNIAVVEDAAHAPGAQLDGRCLGTWGDAGCFSFFANKNMTTGEGGMLVTSRQDIYERVKTLRSHGMTTGTWDRHKGHASSYDVVALGFNYRTSEINAALGITQLPKLSTNTHKRRALTQAYHGLLQGLPEVKQPYKTHRGVAAYHLFPILLEDAHVRAYVMQYLASRGVQTSIHYPPIHRFSFYRTLPQCASANLPVTERVSNGVMTLPLYADMTAEQVHYVSTCVAEALQKL